MSSLLEVEDLTTLLVTESGVLTAVDGVSFSVKPGETVTFIGESGCGKSTLASSVLQLLPQGVGYVGAGAVRFDGTDVLSLNRRELRKLRSGGIAMVPQDPMTALSPVATVGSQLAEVVLATGVNRRQVHSSMVSLLESVQIPDPERRLKAYPHQLSGGMLQRVLIAIALAAQPRLLVADEPTSALDVTVQAGILDLLLDIQQQTDLAIMLITHELGVARQVSDRVNVMYSGRIVEAGPADTVIGSPRMPYTIGLMASTPRVGAGDHVMRAVPGSPPPLNKRPSGCSFRNRCPLATEVCRDQLPVLRETRPGHSIACHLDVAPDDELVFARSAVDLDLKPVSAATVKDSA